MVQTQVIAVIVSAIFQFFVANSPTPWVWPLGDQQVERQFDPPASDYGPGHRGIDIPGKPGETVRAVAVGTVTFAGEVAGVPTITISHGVERSTYQPVKASVRVGDAVDAGQRIGRLGGSHPSCRTTCLNLGRLRGDNYLDPAALLVSSGSYRLISPVGPVPEPPAQAVGHLPLAGPITSSFGMRIHPITGVRKLHDGVDIGAACQTPVPSVAAGKVTISGRRGGYGEQVEVRHRNGMRTSYSHLSRRSVATGAQVRKGSIVGLVGSTGYSTGCHLHFMKIVNGQRVDPVG
ncbi:MAG TPA: peptidoglycan DD-metalloendopeptidase family protein [Aeromicrobium sp.]|nr:peptidoglycan DD-metalloendopeptidase family protein [Aeromicrobium sp.]